MLRDVPHSCSRPLPPTTMPGRYRRLVPVYNRVNGAVQKMPCGLYAVHATLPASRVLPRSAPVSLISTTQPSVIFSNSRSRHASKSRRPGAWSCPRMLSMRMGRPDSVEHTRRCRKCVQPSNLSTPEDICNGSHGSPSCNSRRADACATAAPSVEPAQPSHCCNNLQPCTALDRYQFTLPMYSSDSAKMADSVLEFDSSIMFAGCKNMT